MINSILKSDNSTHQSKYENPINADNLIPDSLKVKKKKTTQEQLFDKKDGFRKMLYQKAQKLNAGAMWDMKNRLQTD
jgi:hypothetical protein